MEYYVNAIDHALNLYTGLVLITTVVCYLGLAVELYVTVHLGSHCILVQKQYCQNLMAQLNSTASKSIYVQYYNCL